MYKFLIIFLFLFSVAFQLEASKLVYTIRFDESSDSIYVSNKIDSLIFDCSAYTSDSLFIVSSNKNIQVIPIANNQYLIKNLQQNSRYIFFASYTKSQKTNIKSITVFVRSSIWWLWTFMGILGGLGLFLFGINFMSDGFIRLMGHRLHKLIEQFSKNAFTSINTGIVLTTIMQSSSAVSIFLTKLIDNQLMSFRQSLGIVVGAALGTTITLQIIALQINSYSLFIIAIGFVFSFLTKKVFLKRLGQVFTGIGLLYLGLQIMSQAAVSIKTIPEVLHFLEQLTNPFWAILIGILFTAITQSASAFIGILIMLGSLNLLTLQASIALFIGSNIGTSVPVLISIGNLSSEAKATAYFHLIYRLMGALIFVFWIPTYTQWVVLISKIFVNDVSLPHLIANAHTIMYIMLTIIFSPFLSFLYKRLKKFVHTDKDKTLYLQAKYINEQSLKTPSIALLLAKKETMHMANIVKIMVEKLLPLFINKDKKLLQELEKEEKAVNMLRDQITAFLLQLNKQNVNEDLIKNSFKLLAIIKELEEIGDIIDTNLLPKARYWIENNYDFSEQGKQELHEYHERCFKLISMVIDVMAKHDEYKASKVKKKEKENIKLAYDLEKSHFSRLIEHVDKTIQSSKTHIELLGLMQAINRHSAQIVRILYDEL
ncbi:MAG: Na/Pi cotransporter family protein [Bacteroidales bacterium]